MYEVEVCSKGRFKDPLGEHILSDIKSIGIKDIDRVGYSKLYIVDGHIGDQEADFIAGELLSDKITESYRVKSAGGGRQSKSISKSGVSVVEVGYKNGVTDVTAESVVKAAKDLGIDKEIRVRTGHRYYLYGKIAESVLKKITVKLLANVLIQEYKIK
jgi:phosphoribosylformylglycinamidine synthase